MMINFITQPIAIIVPVKCQNDVKRKMIVANKICSQAISES